MSNAQGRKNKQESQETLIREGDKVRRVRPDGSDGYIFGNGSGHSPRSDNSMGFSKEHLDWFREEISKHSDESINDLIAKIDRGEPDEGSEYWNILMEEKSQRLDEKMNEVYQNVSSEALRHMIDRHDDEYAKKELARRELLNGDMSWREDRVVDPQNDNIYGETSLVRSGRKKNTMSIDPIISQMPDDQFYALVKIAGAKAPKDITPEMMITAIAGITPKQAGYSTPEKLHGRTKGFWEKVQKEIKLFK